MSRPDSRLLCSLLALLLGPLAHVAAQQKPAPTGLAPVALPRFGLAANAGGALGIGPGYKVQFDSAGAEFTPQLGARAARPHALRLELAAVERGGERMPLAADALPELAELSVSYARAEGLRESFELRAAGVEHAFEFANRPAGSGELVVRLTVCADLEPAFGSAGELRFVEPGLGGLSIGAVRGFDAAGRSVDGSLRWRAGELELVLPESFVDSAALPFVLDPLVGPVIALGSSADSSREPECAYDAASDSYLMVWTRLYSATDHDLYATRIDSAGNPVGGILAIESAGGNWIARPVVGVIAAASRFVIAWQDEPSAGGNPRILARSMHSPSGSLSPVGYLTPASEACYAPDLGSAPLEAGLAPLLGVWLEANAYAIRAAAIGLDWLTSTPAVLAQSALDTGGGAVMVDSPTVSRSPNAQGNHLVVWRRGLAADPLAASLIGSLVDPLTAQPSLGLWLLSSSETSVHRSPDIDCSDGVFVMVYSAVPAGASAADIHAASYRQNATGLEYVEYHRNLSNTLLESLSPAVGCTPGRAFVSWDEQYYPYQSDYDLFVVGVSPQTLDACDPLATVVASSTYEGISRIAAQNSSGLGSGNDALLVWQESLPGEFGHVAAQRIAGMHSGASYDQGGSCGGGGTVELVGPVAVGNDSFRVRVTGADPFSSFKLLNVASPGGFMWCGSCMWHPFQAVFPKAIAGPTAELALPIPCDPSIAGAAVELQWTVLLTTSTPCPSFANISVSNVLQVVVGP